MRYLPVGEKIVVEAHVGVWKTGVLQKTAAKIAVEGSMAGGCVESGEMERNYHGGFSVIIEIDGESKGTECIEEEQ